MQLPEAALEHLPGRRPVSEDSVTELQAESGGCVLELGSREADTALHGFSHLIPTPSWGRECHFPVTQPGLRGGSTLPNTSQLLSGRVQIRTQLCQAPETILDSNASLHLFSTFHVKHFPCVFLFIPHSDPELGTVITFLSRRRNLRSERLSNSPKGTQLVSAGAWI